MMTRIGLIIIGTKKYTRFINPLIQSANNFFFNGREFEVRYFVFSDQKYRKDNVTYFHLQHEPWPYITLKRFHAFVREKERLAETDYLFYCDADMRFVQPVNNDILSDFSATVHPYFYNANHTVLHYERNASSSAFVRPGEGKRYYIGAFYGGKTKQFLSMAETLQQNTDTDLKNGIIALWHDESHLNRYLITHPPEKELDPGYCYPEGQTLPFEAKIIALTKSNQKLRNEDSGFIHFARSAAHRILARFGQN